MDNKIVIDCFENEDLEWFLDATLIAGDMQIEMQDGLVSDTDSFDQIVTMYQRVGAALNIPVEVSQDALDLREGFESE